MQLALEAVFAELTLGPTPTAETLADACQRHGLSCADASALRESFERLLVYRELVRGNLREAVELSIPRTMARLGPLFDEYFDRFLNERAPATHYLRDVTAELLDFCEPHWRSDARVHRYLPDLARHESLHIEISALPALPRAHIPAPLALDAGVAFGAALRLVDYDHAVHELPENESDRRAAPERRVSLLVYRSPEHEVRYLELSPLARGIVLRLLGGAALGSAVQAAAVEAGATLNEAVLAGAARLLADLADRGVIRGPIPPTDIGGNLPAEGPGS